MAATSWPGFLGFVGYYSSISVIAVATLVTVLVVILTNRFISNLFLKSQQGKDGAWNVGMVPYWFPLLGHIPAFAINQDGFLQNLRPVYRLDPPKMSTLIEANMI
jgi:hypothetical protein